MTQRTFPLGARGEHPVFFRTHLSNAQYRELVSLPGVAGTQGGLKCTWDMAPPLARMLGANCPTPPIEANVNLVQEVQAFSGLQRYLDLGLKDKLRTYQKEGAIFLARRAWALNCDPMRCVAGSTEVIVNRGGCARRMTMEQLVYKFNGGQTRGRRWRADVDTYIAAHDEAGSIIKHRVHRAHATGVKEAFRLTTATGREIVTSAEHMFSTPDGYIPLSDLRAGAIVLVRDRAAANREPQKNPYRVKSVRNHPYARVYEVVRQGRPNEIVHQVLVHRLVYEAVHLNGMTLDAFVRRLRTGDLAELEFLSPSDHVHHRDEDPTNNHPDNLLLTTRVEHSRLHAEEGAYRNVLFDAVEDRVARIEAVQAVPMFDLEMDDPYRNYVANDFVVHNSGKSLQALAASVLTGAQKTLIVCPALAKPVWADEIAKWLGEEAVMLEGRAGNYARVYCAHCMSRGYTPVHRHCPDCRLKNGQSNGTRILELGQPERDLRLAIANSRYVIVNFDLLVAQQTTDDRGRKFYRDDLQGWAPFLSEFHFDLCIADESHLLRGWSTDQTKKGQTRRERFCQVTEHIPQVWALTGTPIYGFVRDLWGPLDAISKGAFTGPSRLPFDFHVRYCDGQKGEYGWIADGASVYAQSELVERLTMVKVQRPRSMILSDMPAKVRTVYRVEQDDKSVKAAEKAARLGLAGNKQGRIAKLLSQTGTAKRATVVDNVLAEMAAGDKVVVFTMLRKNAEGIANLIRTKLKKSREWSSRMRQVKAEMWCAHGDTPSQTRFAAARAFREHVGAAVFVTTIDAMQVAVSLKGATSVHFADLHWNPAAMLQAEDRPYEVGTRGLNIVYYVMKGTVDEHVEAVVLPKFKTQESVVGEEGAADVRTTFAGQKETLDQILERLTAHLTGDDEDWASILDDE